MNGYEVLLDEVANYVTVIEDNIFSATGLNAIYESEVVYLDKHLDTISKKIFLSEEYSHHKTSVGNIIDYTKANNRKQEWKARRDSIERLVPLDELIRCSKNGCKSQFEIAEFLEVTESYLTEVLRHYYTKHGTFHLYKRHFFIFNESSLVIIPTN